VFVRVGCLGRDRAAATFSLQVPEDLMQQGFAAEDFAVDDGAEVALAADGQTLVGVRTAGQEPEEAEAGGRCAEGTTGQGPYALLQCPE
jgi:hypothetical protein